MALVKFRVVTEGENRNQSCWPRKTYQIFFCNGSRGSWLWWETQEEATRQRCWEALGMKGCWDWSPFQQGWLWLSFLREMGRALFFPRHYTHLQTGVYIFYSHIKGLPVGNPSEPAGKRYFQNKFVFIFHYLVNKTKYMFLSEVLYFCLDVCNF